MRDDIVSIMDLYDIEATVYFRITVILNIKYVVYTLYIVIYRQYRKREKKNEWVPRSNRRW